MKEIITLLIIVTVQQVLVVNKSTYCVTPGSYSDDNETEVRGNVLTMVDHTT